MNVKCDSFVHKFVRRSVDVDVRILVNIFDLNFEACVSARCGAIQISLSRFEIGDRLHR